LSETRKTSAKEKYRDYHILELAQIAIGEKPPHRTIELRDKFDNLIEKTINENPDLLKDKIIVKNGKIQKV